MNVSIRPTEPKDAEDNKAAIAVYSKYGFDIEGEALCSAFRDGEYISTYYMARLKDQQ
jgi:putative acetyltransferase